MHSRDFRRDIEYLGPQFGIHLHGTSAYVPERGMAHDEWLASDAQPTLVTTANAGVPAFLSTYISPEVIEVLTTPNNAAKIVGESKLGDWVTRTASFPMIEPTGESSAYGDWNNNGATGANIAFPQRQSFHYQTITQWGERQLAEAGNAKIDWAQRLNVASAIVLDKFQNNSYFFGVAGLQNYGLLNDPSLPASITPSTKAAGGTTWMAGTPDEVFGDIQKLFAQLVTQTVGLVEMDAPMVLATSPAAMVALSKTSLYNVNVRDILSKNFPNLTFETAPQYITASGTLAQLIVKNIQGQDTATAYFTEKMRSHAIVQELSAFKQKKSQGTWGTVIFRPVGIVTMLGV
jgi:hypothetical protein